MFAARLRALRCAAAPAEALAASLRPRVASSAFSTSIHRRKPEVEDASRGIPSGFALENEAATEADEFYQEEDPGTRLPLSLQALYHEPLRREPTHGLPVCNLQLRSYSVRNLEFMCDFAMRAAYYCNLPASGPVPLPRKVSRWTVIKGPFVHKKSMENFERVTHKRMIQIKDGHPETVQLWLGFIAKHQYHGVGLKANMFTWEPIGVGKQMQDIKIHDIQEATGTPIYPLNPKAGEKIRNILGTRRFAKLMDETGYQPVGFNPDGTKKKPEPVTPVKEEESATPVSDKVAEEELSARSQAAAEKPREKPAPAAKLEEALKAAKAATPVKPATPTPAPEPVTIPQPKADVNAAHDAANVRLAELTEAIRQASLEVAHARVEHATDNVHSLRANVHETRLDRLADEILDFSKEVNSLKEGRRLKEEAIVLAQEAEAAAEVAAAEAALEQARAASELPAEVIEVIEEVAELESQEMTVPEKIEEAVAKVTVWETKKIEEKPKVTVWETKKISEN